MLLSTYGSILKREILHIEVPNDEFLTFEQIKGELERIKDNYYEIWKKVETLVGEGKVKVKIRYTDDYLYPTLQPTNKGNLIVNNYGQFLQRELVIFGLITYNIWSEYMEASVKDSSIIRLSIPVLASLISKINVSKRPIVEELLTLEATIWLIYHYLSLLKNMSPKNVSIREVEKFLSTYYGIDWSVKQKTVEIDNIIKGSDLTNYDSSVFLELISEHLLKNSKDIVINTLARKINNNILYAFDEPMYSVVEVINSSVLKVHSLSKEIKQDTATRILLLFKKSLRG